MKNKRLEKLKKQEMEAMKTFEKTMKSLNRLDALNIEKKLGIDTESKYEAVEKF